MLDLPMLPPTMTPAWRDHLSPGDVVLFAFPVTDPDRATPKARPCLALEVLAWAGERYARLAYGTSSDGRSNRGHDILVAGRLGDPGAGLDEATRFVGRRTLLVHLGGQGFARSSFTGSPVIGRLTGPALARMHRVRARLQAEADMAAERREGARRTRQRRRELARPAPVPSVAVERRRPAPKVPARLADRPGPEGPSDRRPGKLSLPTSPSTPTLVEGAAR